MVAIIVSPDDLRFTQDSIAIKFRNPYDYLRIDDAVEQLQKGLLTASEFSPMNVVRHNGILWSLDNRRLWVFRRAQVQQVTVNIVSSSYSPRSQSFFMNLDAQLERQYSSPLYYPRVRGRVRSSIFNRVRVSSTVSPVLPDSPYKSLSGFHSTTTSSNWNAQVPVHGRFSSSAASRESLGASRPAPTYTGSHISPDSKSATDDNSQMSFFDMFNAVINFFKRL